MSSKMSNFVRSVPGRVSVFAAASCLWAGTFAVAQAAPAPDGVPSVVISFKDLNLATAEGTRTLYKRITEAARQVCPLMNARDAELVVSTHACREAAIARAVRDINNPQLAALLAEHAKRG
jgi:UrcA family protein